MSKELINEGLQCFEMLYGQKTGIGHFVVTKKGNLLLKKGFSEYEKLTSRDLLNLIAKAVKDASDADADEERAVILMNLYHELRPIITLLKKDFFDYLAIKYLSSIERNFLIILFGVEEYIKKFCVEEI